MFEVIKNNKQNIFYKVNMDSLKDIEEDMGIMMPNSIKSLYSEVGYGFLESQYFNNNRIMGPNSIKEFRLGIGKFENSDEVEINSQYGTDKLIFFEVHDSLFLSIGITKENRDKIYYYDEEIASDLIDFFEKYTRDEKYFLGK